MSLSSNRIIHLPNLFVKNNGRIEPQNIEYMNNRRNKGIILKTESNEWQRVGLEWEEVVTGVVDLGL